MDNKVETASGEIVEIINGTLICENKAINLITIADWLSAQNEHCPITDTIRVADKVQVEFPEYEPTHRMLSLLQHFEHQ